MLEPSYLHKGSDWRLCFMCFLSFAPASFVIASKPSSKFQGHFPQFPRGARCASNALQQLHHSFNFYFFTGPNSHISNGRGLLGLGDTKGFPVLLGICVILVEGLQRLHRKHERVQKKGVAYCEWGSLGTSMSTVDRI